MSFGVAVPSNSTYTAMYFDLKKTDGTVVFQRQTARAYQAISASPPKISEP
jgi:hypothetical protein